MSVINPTLEDKAPGGGYSSTEYNTLKNALKNNAVELQNALTAIGLRLTTEQAQTLIEGYGYQTAQQVLDAITNNITPINTALATKASTTDLTNSVSTLNTAISGKANTTDLTNLVTSVNTALATKASTTDLTNSVSTLNTAISGKANTTELNTAVTTINTALGTKVTQVGTKVLSDENYTTNEKNKLASISASAVTRKNFGIIIPQFKVANRFDNMGAALNANQLAIHSSGTGLVSSTAGTFSDGYLKLKTEVEGANATRTDWLLSIDMSEVGASFSVGLGNVSTGWVVSGSVDGSGNLTTTFPSGATKTGALSGIQQVCVSITSGNMGITCSLHILGTPAALAANNPYRVPIYEYAKSTKGGLWSAYFKINSVASKIVGFLHCATGWNGDPFNQLLTRTMIVNGAGYVGEHDNMIIIPERSNSNNPLKVSHFFHGRTLTGFDIINNGIGDNGETARQLLYNQYALLGTSAGVGNTNVETDWWGNATGTQRAGEVYDTLSNNVTGVGKEYLIGWSMGGCSATNYAKLNCDRVAAVWLSCPVLDLEQTGVRSPQGDASLKASLDRAYEQWYYNITATTADPQTDVSGAWRLVSQPGGLPCIGMTNFSVTTVQTAATASTQITLVNANRIQPGMTIYFKYAGVQRKVLNMVAGSIAIINIDSPVTVIAGENVSILREPSYDFKWFTRPLTAWTNATSTVSNFYRRSSATPLNDIIPNNPKRSVDIIAELNIPYHIMVGGLSGDSTRTGNDGILNNNQMYDFADAVNAITPGLVNMIVGSGAHNASTTMSATDVITFYNSH